MSLSRRRIFPVFFFVQIIAERREESEQSDHAVLVDVIVCAPPGTPRELSKSLRPGLSTIVARQVENFVEPKVDGAVTEPVWNAVVRSWKVTDYGHFDAAAGLLDKTGNLAHSAVGKAAGALAGPAGPKTAAVAGALAQGAALPLDKPLTMVSTFLRVGAAVVGVALGHPLLAIKSVQSLAHSEVTKMRGKTVGLAVKGVLAPEPEVEREPRPEERTPDKPSLVKVPTIVDHSDAFGLPGIIRPGLDGIDRFGGIGGF